MTSHDRNRILILFASSFIPGNCNSSKSFQESANKNLRCYHCPQTFIDMKSLQIHIFVDHQNIKGSYLGQGQGPPNKVIAQPAPSAQPLPPPPHALPRSIPMQPQQPPLPLAVNGHHYQAPNDVYRRQTSSSSDMSDSHGHNSPAPAVNSFNCDLCGMTGIPDRTTFKQVHTLRED